MTMLPNPFGGFGQDMPQIDPQQIKVPQPKNPGGMFGGGGERSWANAIQALVGGYLAGRKMPGGEQILDQLNKRQLISQQIALMQMKRQQGMDDFKAQYDYKLKNPMPRQPTEYERLLSARGIQPGTSAFNKHLDAYLNMRENPPQYRIDPTTGAVIMLQSNPMGMGEPAPEGVTFTPVEEDGGPSPQGSGGFPF